MIQYQIEETGQIIQVPEVFVCPISRELITDPVQAVDGFNYQRQSITAWLKTNKTSPFTRAAIGQTLFQNVQFKKMTQTYWKARKQLKQAKKIKQAILQAAKAKKNPETSQTSQKNSEKTQKNPQQICQIKNQSAEQSIIQIHDGFYKGELKDGKRDGHGIFISANGDMYEGQWQNDKEQGFGMRYYNDQRLYEGYWKQGLNHGENCKMYHIDGNMFDGTVVYGIAKGLGKFYLANGRIYEGNFQNNQFNGFGKMTYINGMIYNGNWKSSNFDGFGKLQQADGFHYQGEWIQGKKHGKGKIANKDKWIQTLGQFEKDQIHGYAYNAIGSTNTNSYKGYYVKGVLSGYGENKSPTQHYWGQYKQGKSQGYGRVLDTKPDGNYYEGYFKNGKPNGQGKCYCRSDPYKDCYYQGQMVERELTGYGKCTYSDGSIYIGDWKKFKRQGFGTYVKFKKEMAPQNKEKQELRVYIQSQFKNGKYLVESLNINMVDGEFEERQSKQLLEVLERKQRDFEIQFNLAEYEFLDFQYIYVGEWADDQMCGMGTMKYPDETSYQGYFLNGLRNGKGKLVKIVQNQIEVLCEGQWQKGQLKEQGQKNVKQNVEKESAQSSQEQEPQFESSGSDF